jgi:hypothetical protein
VLWPFCRLAQQVLQAWSQRAQKPALLQRPLLQLVPTLPPPVALRLRRVCRHVLTGQSN